MIAKLPHPIFSAAWGLWLALVLTALAMPTRPLFGLFVLLAFLPIEGLAVVLNTGARDTLSEITTWVFRHLSKHTRPGRGWNALLLLVILAIAYLLGRTVAHYSGSWFLAIVMGGLTVVWLHDHFLRPDLHG
jgi:hypothetical protein